MVVNVVTEPFPSIFCVGDDLTISRTYTAEDDCGNTATCVQNFTFIPDDIPPMITCPANVTIECDESTDPANTGSATATDECSPDDQIIISSSDISTQGTSGCSQYLYTITRTWTATDVCGNVAQCVQIINVEDTTPPVITCPGDVTIECDESTSPDSNGFATATDNCSATDEIVITWNDISTQGTSGCSQYEYTITRTWTATDACGNNAVCVQIINVEDTTPPEPWCPASTTIECDESTSPDNTGSATATDNCSATDEIVITWNDVSDQGTSGCSQYEYTIIRTWTATDACGNASDCIQVIEVEDSTAPVISCPADATVNCDDPTDVGTLGSATATDNCSSDDEITVDWSDVSTQGQGCLAYSYIIIRTWSATDACGNESTCSQVITVQDLVAPSITCPADIEVDCSDPTDPGLRVMPLLLVTTVHQTMS